MKDSGLLSLLDSFNAISLFIKLFGIVLSVLYLFFAVIMAKQVQVMKKAIMIADRGVLGFLSMIQVVLAFLIILYAFFIL